MKYDYLDLIPIGTVFFYPISGRTSCAYVALDRREILGAVRTIFLAPSGTIRHDDQFVELDYLRMYVRLPA
jgi:hypothetical protein